MCRAHSVRGQSNILAEETALSPSLREVAVAFSLDVAAGGGVGRGFDLLAFRMQTRMFRK